MAAATTYVRQFNFSNQQSAMPSDPLPAAQVDNEFNAVKTALDETQANLVLIQRADGALKNASVGLDQLKDEVTIGVNAPTAWVLGATYAVNDTVTQGSGFYRCLVAHTAGVFSTDLAAAKWELLVDFAAEISSASIASNVHASTAKSALVDNDEFGGVDTESSNVLTRFTWASVKAAMFSAWGVLVTAGTSKATPVDADTIALSDSAASDATKKLTWANVKATLKTYFDTLYLITASTTEVLTGTDTSKNVTPNALAALWEAGADNSDGATITMGEGGYFNLISSTTAITAFAFTTDKAGRTARIRFNTARTLTHNATSLILPGGANIAAVAGDIMGIRSLGSGNFEVEWYTRAAYEPPVITPWVAYTPTFTGFGTPTGISFSSRRVGDTLEVRGTFTPGSTTAVEARITLGFNGTDGNVTASSTKLGTGTNLVGSAAATSSASYQITILAEQSVGYMTVGVSATNGGMTKANGNAVLTTRSGIVASIPIEGW